VLAVTLKGHLLASAGRDGIITVWDLHPKPGGAQLQVPNAQCRLSPPEPDRARARPSPPPMPPRPPMPPMPNAQ
jgi:hypothetical protein